MNGVEIPLSRIEGIGERAENRLREYGITSALELASSLPDEIIQVIGGDVNNASMLIANARSCLTNKGLIFSDFVRASEIAKKRNDIMICTTGSKALDKLLGGGIETKAITEFFGAFGSGKSQLCHTLAVLCQMQADQGGMGGSSIYIDTEGTFRVNRIAEIASARGIYDEGMLDRILYCRAYDVQHLISIVRTLGQHIRENDVKLVIVDSVISLFRSEYIGRETLTERQQKLSMLMHKLHNLAEVYNVAVVITNQVQATPNAFFGDPNRPAGGHILAHGSTYRVYLRKVGEKGERLAAIIDSPIHPYSEARFTITTAGISDISQEKCSALIR